MARKLIKPLLYVWRLFFNPNHSTVRRRATYLSIAVFYLIAGSGMLLILRPDRVQAATGSAQGYKFSASSSDCTQISSIGTRSWVTPGNAYSSNGLYTTASLLNGTYTYYLTCTNFGFSIPTGATIVGITLGSEAKANCNYFYNCEGGVEDYSVRLVKNGIITGSSRAEGVGLTTGDYTNIFGTPTDLWGLTWTPADINSASFGGAISYGKPIAGSISPSVYVDSLSIAVYYTVPTNLGLSGYQWLNNSTDMTGGFAQTLGGGLDDIAKDVAIDASGNVYSVGYTNSTNLTAGSDDQTLVKYNSSGTEQWSKTWGGDGIDRAHAVKLDSSGNVYVVGETRSSGFTAGLADQTLVKYNSSGTEQWSKTWGGTGNDYAHSLVLDGSNNIYVAGYTASTDRSLGSNDISLVKYNSSGVEQWSKTWGGTASDIAYSGLALDASGNIYIAGTSNSAGITSGNSDIVLVKYNASGVVQWSKSWDYNGDEEVAYDLVLDSSNNIYVVGYVLGLTNFEQVLIKFNSSGVEQWAKTWGGSGSERARSVALDSSGNIYVVGFTDSSGLTAGGTDQTLVKFNSSGVEQWSKTWGTASDEYAYSLAMDSFGTMYLAGYTNDSSISNGSYDQTLLKFTNNGYIKDCTYCVDRTVSEVSLSVSEVSLSVSEVDRTLSEVDIVTNENDRAPLMRVACGSVGGYVKTWGGTAFDSASAVAIDTSNNVYVVGLTQSSDRTAGSADQTLVKYDSSGVEQWSKTWGGTGNDEANAIVLDSSGNIYVAGYTSSPDRTSGSEDQTLVKYDSSGVEQWSKTWGGTGTDIAYSIALDSSGNIYVAGYTSSPDRTSGSEDQTLVKYNSSGVEQWSKTWGGTGIDIAKSLKIDSLGNIYVVGYADSADRTSGAFDQTLVKYDSSGVEQWSKTWGGTGDDYSNSIVIDASGNIFVTGITLSTDRTSAFIDQTLVKYDSSGVEQWSKTWGGNQDDNAYSLTLDSSGNIYVAGSTNSSDRTAGGTDQTLVKYNSSGVEQWSKTWGGTGTDIAYSIALDSSGNIYVAGVTASADRTVSSSTDQTLWKIDTAGVYCSGSCTDRTVSETDRTVSETDRTVSETDRTFSETDRTVSETDRTVSETSRDESILEQSIGILAGTPLNSVAMNTSTLAPSIGTPFRLRFNLHVSTSNLQVGYLQFRLQYAAMSGSCDTGFSGESYADIGTSSSAPISYYDNSILTDGGLISSTSNDPTDGAHPNTMQQYVESTNFGISNAVTVGNDALWDVSLKTNSVQSPSSYYCIRIVTYSGGTLSSYSYIPTIQYPNSAPNAPTLNTPLNNATDISALPQFSLGTVDLYSDYVRYKIEVCADSLCSSVIRTITQTDVDQVGWSGQTQQNATAYGTNPSTITEYGTHQYQAPALSENTQYWWRAYAIDPGGSNTWSSASSIRSFTTSRKQVLIKGGVNIGNTLIKP